MKDYSLGYEDGYVDVKRGQYEEPVGTPEYNRGYREGAQARRGFEAAPNDTEREWIDASTHPSYWRAP